MIDEHEEKTVRLLNIIDQIALAEGSDHDLDLPFTVNDEVVKLSSRLHGELLKPENEDLLGWARENIVNLFE